MQASGHSQMDDPLGLCLGDTLLRLGLHGLTGARFGSLTLGLRFSSLRKRERPRHTFQIEDDVFANAADGEDAGVLEGGGDFRRGRLKGFRLFAEPDGLDHIARNAHGEAARDGFNFWKFGHACQFTGTGRGPPTDVGSVCGLGIAKEMTICLGEEFQSYSNLLLILFHHRSQEVHEFVNLGRVFLAGEVTAEGANTGSLKTSFLWNGFRSTNSLARYAISLSSLRTPRLMMMVMRCTRSAMSPD